MCVSLAVLGEARPGTRAPRAFHVVRRFHDVLGEFKLKIQGPLLTQRQWGSKPGTMPFWAPCACLAEPLGVT